MRATVRSRRLGARLGRYRNQRGLSGAELAAELGVGQPQWSRMETGKAQITPATLTRLVELLGIPETEPATLMSCADAQPSQAGGKTTATSSANQSKCSSSWKSKPPGSAATKATSSPAYSKPATTPNGS